MRQGLDDTESRAGVREDALNISLAIESRFDLAYNAAHALCLAALRWNGYRSTNRFLVLQLLPTTLNLGPEVWRVLSKCHDIRSMIPFWGDHIGTPPDPIGASILTPSVNTRSERKC
jgi:hypothetical protein